MATEKTSKKPSFEQALEELETMVETMESGQLPLEELISSYERGASLVSHCESVLNNARKRLELITLKPKEEPKPSSNNSTTHEPATGSNDKNDDEIRLF